MNYAVTGGAGFIGSHIIKRLVSMGHNVIAVDNLSRGSMDNLEDMHDKINFVNTDILKYDQIKEALCDVDGIFHQAAMSYIPNSYENKDTYQRVNVVGSENIFKIGLQYDIKIAYASSSTVYGNGSGTPIQEDSPKRPLNPYGMTKLEAERVAARYAKKGARIISLRYFNVIGLGRKQEYSGAIPRFLDRLKDKKPPIIYGDGLQLKDFVSIHDVVQANLDAMHGDIADGFFNIGSGSPITIKDLAYLMIGMSGQSLEPIYHNPRPGDARNCIADITKAAKLLNWSPKITLNTEIKNLLDQA